MARDDLIEVEGKVINNNHGFFTVECNISGIKTLTVKCKPSGKIQLSKIKILNGDEVVISVSPYDLTRGRIIYRKR